MGKIPTLYFCSYDKCTASFRKKERYECHLCIHSGERPFVCSIESCGKSYRRLSHLKRHAFIHNFSFRCAEEGCSEILKTSATLKKHIDVEHKNKKPKKYKCTNCNQEFNKHNWLQRHLCRCIGIKRFVCPHPGCERFFTYQSRLRKHMKVHDGYKCEKFNCGKSFSKWSELVQHSRENHRKVHKCKICERAFSSSSNLKMHESIHQQSRELFECQEPSCPRVYLAKKNLTHHMKMYHGKRPYNCSKENCFRCFKTESNLEAHILNHDSKRPKRKKKKKRKPTFSEILAGFTYRDTTEEEESKSLDLKESEINKETVIASFEVPVVATCIEPYEIIITKPPNDNNDIKNNGCITEIENIFHCNHVDARI